MTTTLYSLPCSSWFSTDEDHRRICSIPSSREIRFTRYQIALHSEKGYLQHIPLVECGIMIDPSTPSTFQPVTTAIEPHSKQWYPLPSHLPSYLPSLFLRLTLPPTVNPNTCHVALSLHGMDSSMSLKQSTSTK
jgi:hypothetical protein